MTKKELEQIAEKAAKEGGLTPTSDSFNGYVEGFMEAYRLLTTPLPMSTAPRGGLSVLLCASKTLREGHWFDGHWRMVGKYQIANDHDFTGWLPIFTPIEEDAN